MKLRNLGILMAIAAAVISLSACTTGDPVGPAGPTERQSTAPATQESEPTEQEGSSPAPDNEYFDHVVTNSCDPGKASDGYLGRVHVVATIKNISNDSPATYVLNYKIFDPKGMQVGAVIIDATAYNGPIPYGDTVQVDDHYEASTGKIPADGRFTCKLFKVDRMTN